ncbi:ABC transporter permease, partial [Acinetobacter baumannii]|nr:ABC transporter permease [Acinetobacter baumannii]
MSFIVRSRLQKFRQHKLGWASFILFSLILVMSLAAEFIANDKPLLVKYEDAYYLPVFKVYPETTFGGVFETEADYKDPAVQELINHKGWVIWPLIQFSYQTPNLDLAVPVPSPPSKQNWLGTDDQGRDVLARILYGLRVSLLFGLALTASAALLGIFVGAIQGYYGGWVDLLGQRLVEVWNGLPMLFMVMILV